MAINFDRFNRISPSKFWGICVDERLESGKIKYLTHSLVPCITSVKGDAQKVTQFLCQNCMRFFNHSEIEAEHVRLNELEKD